MPQWAGSCWYYLRYVDPHNDRAAWDPSKERYWMNIDLYVGGAEHAVLHLLYARFWHKVLYDAKLVSTKEPFQRLINQGLILGEDGEKMSKSRGNVVNPDDVIRGHGADAFRLYEMFMGPLEAVKPWSTRSIEGVDRFLGRAWRLVVAPDDTLNPAIQAREVDGELKRVLHRTIRDVAEDLEHLRLNTAISKLMVLLNRLSDEPVVPRQAVDIFILLLSPLAPHIAEELWQRLGHAKSLAYEPWPAYDPAALEQTQVLWIVQVNGKMRAKLTLPAEVSDEQLKQAALADAQVRRYVDGQAIKQVIVVPKRLINIVV
jgi:leucyl-tRNA synthetase